MTTYTVQSGSRILAVGLSADDTAALLCVPTTQLEQLCATQGYCTKVLDTLAVWTAVSDRPDVAASFIAQSETSAALGFPFGDVEHTPCDWCSSFDFSCTGLCRDPKVSPTGRLVKSQPEIQNLPGTPAHVLEVIAARYGTYDQVMSAAIIGIHPSAFDKPSPIKSGYGPDGSYYDAEGRLVEELEVWKDYMPNAS